MTDQSLKILCANWEEADDGLLERELFPDIEFVLHRLPADPDEALSADLCRDVDAVVNYSGARPLGAPPSAFGRCRIAVRSGVGFDNLDLVGWGARGVPVCNVPDYGTTEVADHAIALMLSLLRGTANYDRALRGDIAHWDYAGAPLVRRLRGATFGIVGLGRIGLATARRAAAFDMRILFYDPHLPNGIDLATGYGRVHNLHDLLSRSDVVSIHTPLTEATRGLIDGAALAFAKPGLVVVNTARGPIIDLDALADALQDGRLGGAALDVLPREPADRRDRLIAAWEARESWLDGRLILTPHSAFFSPDAMRDLRTKSIEIVVAYLRDQRLTNCVNLAELTPEARVIHWTAPLCAFDPTVSVSDPTASS